MLESGKETEAQASWQHGSTEYPPGASAAQGGDTGRAGPVAGVARDGAAGEGSPPAPHRAPYRGLRRSLPQAGHRDRRRPACQHRSLRRRPQPHVASAGLARDPFLERRRDEQSLRRARDHRCGNRAPPHLTPALSATLLIPSNAGRSLRELGSRALRRWGAEREAIGIGGSLAAPPLPHHRAYGSVHGGSTDLSDRAVFDRSKAEPGEEGVRHRVGERGAVADPPWAVGTAGGLRRQVLADAEAA